MEFRQVKTRFPSGDGMDEDEMQISAVASTVPTRLTGNKRKSSTGAVPRDDDPIEACVHVVTGDARQFSAAEHSPVAPSVGFSASPGAGGCKSWEKACLQTEAAFLATRKNTHGKGASHDKSTHTTNDTTRSTISAAASNGHVVTGNPRSSLAPRTISFDASRREATEANDANAAHQKSQNTTANGGGVWVSRRRLPRPGEGELIAGCDNNNNNAGTGKEDAAMVPTTPPGSGAASVDGSVGSLGLPPCVVAFYARVKKITTLYPWQVECLRLDGVFNHRRNLVYCAPTSGGKSLVSDVLLIKRLTLKPGSIGLMVLPFVTLCRERSDELELALRGTKIVVRRCFGGASGRLPPVHGGGGLVVCTPEKFNDLITNIIEQDRVGELSSVVVDELHMVQDASRGGTLEGALTKLLFASAKLTGFGHGASPISGDPNGSRSTVSDHTLPLTDPSGGMSEDHEHEAQNNAPQIIGMSATLSDVDGLRRWFGGAFFETEFRPVPLRVCVVSGRDVFALPDASGDLSGGVSPSLTAGNVRSLKSRSLPDGSEMARIVELVREAVAEPGNGTNAGGVIVFCAAKFQCEIVSAAIAKALVLCPGLVDTGPGRNDDPSVPPDHQHPSVPLGQQNPSSVPPGQQKQSNRQALVDALTRLEPKKQNTQTATETESSKQKLTLARCASLGVVWHHAALRPEEKGLVEQGFRSGEFKVVCCTSTMATGVNLPAKRVVVTSPYHFRRKPALHDLLKSKDLRQMVGRAGRAGFGCDVGEAFVMAPNPGTVRWGLAAGGQKDATGLLVELARRLSHDGETLSSTIAQQGMRRVMLEAVACGLACGPGDIKRYIQCTLLNALNDFQDVVAKSATEALKWLAERNFLQWCPSTHRWSPSALGRAAAAAHLDPDAAVAVVEGVRAARKCLILESDLHLLFLCVPPDPPAAVDVTGGSVNPTNSVNVELQDAKPSSSGRGVLVPQAASTAPTAPMPSSNPDDECWLNEAVFCRIYRGLSEHEQIVASVVGISESYYNRLENRLKDKSKTHRELRRVCHRFLKALQLHDVVCERDVLETATAFGVSPGVLTQTQESAARHAGQIVSVCGPMGWGDVEGLVLRLQDRIAAGAREEILSLTSIPMIGASRARVLYTAGYRTPEAILTMSLKQLALLFEGSKGAAGQGEGQMRAAHTVMRGARRVCEDARRAAREESEAKLRKLQALAPIIETRTSLGDGISFGVGDDEEVLEGATPVRNKKRKVDVVPPAEVFDPKTATGAVVVRRPKDIAALEAFWRASSGYTFVLRPGTNAVSSGRGTLCVSPPVAIALAFPSNPNAVFYAPIVLGFRDEHETARDGDVEADANDAAVGARRGFVWETVRAILSTSGKRKATVDLKPQLLAMGAANLACLVGSVGSNHENKNEKNETENQHLYAIGVVAPPVFDARVGGWLLRPESSDFACGTNGGWSGLSGGDRGASSGGGVSESLQRAFAGDLNSNQINAATAWPSRFGKFPNSNNETSTTRRNHAAAAATTTLCAVVAAVDLVIAKQLSQPGFEGLRGALTSTEMPLVPVLAAMESVGVPFETETLRVQIAGANKRLLEIEHAASEIVANVDGAAPASLTSSNDVARVLFEDLKLPPPPCALVDTGNHKAGTGHPRRRRRVKTDCETLQFLVGQHPFPALVMEHRSLSKCVGMAEELVELAMRGGCGLDGLGGGKSTTHGGGGSFSAGDFPKTKTRCRLFGTIHQTNCETGRLAMEDPNLQNLPYDRPICGALGNGSVHSPNGSQTSLAVRSAFKAPRGRVLLAADYKQLELRVAAHLSGDAGFVAAFGTGTGCDTSEAAGDPFLILASRWRRVPVSEVSKKDRAVAKKLAYCTLFGGGANRFASETGCSAFDAKQLQEGFRQSIPGVETWRQRVVRDAKNKTPPHVVTIGGRRRHLPGLAGGGATAAGDARKAVNTATQGGASDIVKRAMIEIHNKLAGGGLRDGGDDDATFGAADADDANTVWSRLRRGNCRLLLQVHDELVFEVDESDAVVAVRAIRALMQNAGRVFSLTVRLPVKISVGWDYGDMTEARY